MKIESGREVARRIGMELIQQKKAAFLSAGRVEKKSIQDKDLLSLLVKANMAEDIPTHQRLSDQELLARTFFA